MKHERIIQRKNLWPLSNLIVVSLIVLLGTLGYFQVEAATVFFSDDIGDINAICESRLQSLPKYYKVTYYNKSQGVVKVYCISDQKDNPSQNSLELTLNKRNTDTQWNVVVVTDLNKNRALYWPVYQ